jgi:hypothetical protein
MMTCPGRARRGVPRPPRRNGCVCFKPLPARAVARDGQGSSLMCANPPPALTCQSLTSLRRGSLRQAQARGKRIPTPLRWSGNIEHRRMTRSVFGAVPAKRISRQSLRRRKLPLCRADTGYENESVENDVSVLSIEISKS